MPVVLLLALLVVASGVEVEKVPVRGHVEKIGLKTVLVEGASLSVVEHPEWGKVLSGADGTFQFPDTLVGDQLTVHFERKGYKTMNTATITVPQGGCAGEFHEIVVQAFAEFTYLAGLCLVPGVHQRKKCQFVVTVTALGKSLKDHPQGEEGATVTIEPDPGGIRKHYFGFSKHNGKTNPFKWGLKQTSRDGGVFISNVPPSDHPYVVRAHKDGKVFREAVMNCPVGASKVFVNAAPPWGPTVLASPNRTHQQNRKTK